MIATFFMILFIIFIIILSGMGIINIMMRFQMWNINKRKQLMTKYNLNERDM